MNTVDLNLNGKILTLSERDAQALASLTDHPGYAALSLMLEALEEGTRLALADTATPLDSIRALQGRLSVASDVDSLLRDGIPSWVGAMREEQA